MSTVAAPVLVSVTVCASVFPTVTLPKASLIGLSDSCPVAVAVPTPVSEMFVLALDALLITESVALKVATVLGENEMLIVALCPGATVAGRLGAVREKNCVEMAALLTVIEVSPLFVAVKVNVLLVPAGTLPKSRPVVPKVRTLLEVV
jgi:hypothetical protein